MKQEDFLGEFVGSNTLARIIRVLVLNYAEQFTLAYLAKRAAASLRSTQSDLKILEKMGLIIKERAKVAHDVSKKKKQPKAEVLYSVNPNFRHLRALSAFVHETSPAEYSIILEALKRSGKLSAVILSGAFTSDQNRPADLIIAGDALNDGKIESAVRGLEGVFGREIRYAAFSMPELRYRMTIQDRLIRDTLDFPHVVLLDRSKLFSI